MPSVPIVPLVPPVEFQAGYWLVGRRLRIRCFRGTQLSSNASLTAHTAVTYEFALYTFQCIHVFQIVAHRLVFRQRSIPRTAGGPLYATTTCAVCFVGTDVDFFYCPLFGVHCPRPLAYVIVPCSLTHSSLTDARDTSSRSLLHRRPQVNTTS